MTLASRGKEHYLARYNEMLEEPNPASIAAMRQYFVYMLRCSDHSFYIGVTNDYKKRIAKHAEGVDPTCYTFKRRPLELVHVESFREVMDAIRREKQLKRWSRKKKEALIKKEWEELPALSESSYAKRIRSIRVMVRRAHHDTLGITVQNASPAVSP